MAADCSPFDVGIYAFPWAKPLSNEQKYDFVQKCWNPDALFSFPKTAEGKNMSQRSFRHEWLRIYPWLRYSRMYDGAFCLPCVIFGCNSVKLDKLFKSPLSLWSSAVSKFAAHQSSRMHKHCVQDLQIFKVSMQNQRHLDIDQLLSVERSKRIQENREKLAPILKCVIYCGQTNQGLRGHRDDSNHSEKQQGNFRTLVDFRVDAGDVKLKEHLEIMKRNETYLSKTTQNQLIEATAKFIRENIINDINTGSRFYSILADEAADIANKEQLAMVIRYVDAERVIREAF